MNNLLKLLRVAAVSPRVYIGDVEKNCKEIMEYYEELAYKADVIVTPELSLTGYTCQDMFNNRRLIEETLQGIEKLVDFTKDYGKKGAVLVVGFPLELDGELFNCAGIIHNSELLALIPKQYLPNYGEFYEKRWFSARECDAANICIHGENREINTVFGNNVIIEIGNKERVCIGVEVCEDAWAPVSPGRIHAVNGAEVILNLSASNEVIGKASYRRNLIQSISASCICGYVYVSAGRYESTSDLVFSGHNMIFENGKLVDECRPFEDKTIISDINLTKIRHDRIANKTFGECKRNNLKQYTKVRCNKEIMSKEHILAKVSVTPFVPSKNKRERCIDIFNMQVAGLRRRIETTRCKCIVVGVSGGLDSTLALLVSAQAVKKLGLPSTTVVGITMPGFGTTHRTEDNSLKLMKYLGCDTRNISIVDSVRQHFKDIGQDEAVHDVTYENCQARERTQILMDVANKEGGFVIGTGDLSELALGWCTYNGDHMSMYAVNASIPKTLVRTLVDEIGHEMDENGFDGLGSVIEDIIDTPVSPELLPPNPDGTIAQKTEDTVGSYVLHDFFMYYTLRYGMTPKEVYTLCKEAVAQSDIYRFSDQEIDKWLKVFYDRFYKQQFKRNCMPDGVKVGTVSVSPRGDLRLPSEMYS